ncbi:MAG TPA: branched-chain amino acid ABC transporter permease [Pseudolysinimonas sp.]|nr:branched-chain amino acid ABC transporter permease [Pseudolysinimonas sp.]
MSKRRTVRWIIVGALAVIGIVLPAFLEDFWLQLGALVFTASIGAIGLMLLFGRVGQLSLGHPFFLGIGAYSYVWLASPSGDDSRWGLGLPSLLAIPLAVIIAAVVGVALSPLAARLKGLSLGLATLSLIFIGVWLFYTLEPLTGGFNGRGAPALQIGPLSSTGSNLAIAGMPLGGPQFLWYVALILLVAVSAFTVALLKGRVGRAFTAIRDAEVHAAALGVNVGHYRAIAFAISSAYAGLAGSLLAIIIQLVTPDYWGLALSLSYLAMVVIGGMRSVAGAILGALFVMALPAILQRFGGDIPGVGSVGGGGIGPAVVAQIIYGVVVIVVLIFEPQGLVRIIGRLVPKRWRRVDAA